MNFSLKSLIRQLFFVENGWTRAQYALFRVCLGLHLLVTNIFLAFSAKDTLALSLACVGATLSTLLTFGKRERLSAYILAALWALFFGVKPNGPHDSQQLLVFVLLAHSEIAPTRQDLEGVPWRLPQPVHALLWIIGILFYVYYGAAVMLGSEFPIISVLYVLSPLALLPTLRPWIWLVNTCVSFVLIFGIGDIVVSLLLFQLFLLDPKWIKPKRTPVPELLFYDGECGLCHKTVLLVLEEDKDGSQFLFSPLQGETIKDHIPEAIRQTLPDSIVVLAEDNQTLTKSQAVAHILEKLGGLWRLFSYPLRLPMVNFLYDIVAKIRKRLFITPATSCPLVPSRLQQRFLP